MIKTSRKLNKTEGKIWKGLLLKVLNFIGDLTPDERKLLVAVVGSMLKPSVDDDTD